MMQTATLLIPSTVQAQTKSLVTEKLLTGAEALDLGIARPFELVNGKIVYMDVYRTPTEFTQLTEQETVYGEGILEGFALPLRELFADLP